MTLAIDFDGVLHDPKRRKQGYKMGMPIVGAVESMKVLQKAGHLLIIHTIWATNPAGINAIRDWLEYFSIPFDFITANKPDADLYIDDKAIKFENWAQIMDLIGV